MKRSASRPPRGILVLLTLALAALPALADSGPEHQVPQSPPIKMGTSGGSADDLNRFFCCSGTLGSLIERDGVIYILSNNHVLARAGAAVIGEKDIQPGLADIQCNASQATVVGTFPGNLVPLGTANVDIGLSKADTTVVDTTGAILDVGPPCTATQDPAIGMAVMKSGRTTGLTQGTVQAIDLSVRIQYQPSCGHGRKFNISYTNQVAIAPGPAGPFSAGGDSGSLILSDDGTPNPVALLYAGSSTVTVGNPVGDVVSALTAGGHTFGFVGQACTATAASAWGAASRALSSPAQNDVEVARTVKERHEPDLLARPEVAGVGVGADVTDPSRAVIVVYVEAAGAARPHGLPAELDGVKVRVIPTATIVAQQDLN